MARQVRRSSPRRLPRGPLPAVAALSVVAAACASGGRAAGRALEPAPLPAWAAHYTTEGRELTADQQARQALSRLTFGARPGDYERVRLDGVDRWVDRQLFPERLSDSADRVVAARWPATGEAAAQLFAESPPPAQALAPRALGGAAPTPEDSARREQLRRQSRAFVVDLQAARTARAVAGERQLQEVMVDFWENHFNVYAAKDRLRYHLPEYDALIRAHAMGRFRDLLGAVAHSPAMLEYLDNWQSRADSAHATLAGSRGRPYARARGRGLNENYGRELLELHTLGVDGGYTQRDVVEVARALTGWTVAPPAQGAGFVFRPEWHDADAKTILGQSFPAGRGEDDGERVLDLLARHPSTARFVARKLCVRFVSDAPGAALVARAADAFARSDGDVRATLAVILHSPEFFSRAAYRAKVKTPFELVASAARALGAAADTTPRTAQLVARLGQPLFGHQAPDGWPETGDAWLNTGTILGRINFGEAVAASRLPGARLAAWPGYAALRGRDRDAQIDGVVAAFLGGEASPDTRAVLGRGENPLATRAARAAGADSAAPPPPRGVEPLAQLVGLALGAPEFQRR